MRNFLSEVQAARSVKFPALRRYGVVGIIRNGSSQRVYECCQCGDTVSMCAKWPMPKSVGAWISRHQSVCGAALLGSIGVASPEMD